MKDKKKKEIIDTVKANRRAKRQVDIEERVPQEHSKVWKTHIRDIEEKRSNNIKWWEEYED